MRGRLGAALAACLLWHALAGCGPDDPAAWEERAAEALEAGRSDAEALDRAIHGARRALELDSTRVAAAHLLARAYRGAGRYEDAAGVYRGLVERRPMDPAAYVGLGACLAAQGRYNGALRAYQDAVFRGEQTPEVYTGLGHAYQALGHRRENLLAAQASYRASLARGQAAPTADLLYHMARVAARLENNEEALAFYTEALTRDPDDRGVRVELAAFMVQTGQRRRAGGVLAEGLERDPAAADLRYELGRLLWGDGDAEGALEQFRLALEADPSLVLAHRYAGLIHSGRGEYEKALESFAAVEAQRPDDAPLQVSIGIVLAQRGDLDGAEARFLRALESGATAGDAALKLGGLYVHRNDPAAAARIFRRGLEEKADHAELHASLGDALRRLGSVGSAIEAGEEAVRLEPERALWHFYLALGYERLDPQAARRVWERYIALAGADPAEAQRLPQARQRLAALPER